MKNTIIELWNGRLEPYSGKEEKTAEIALLLKYIERHFQNLEQRLNDEGRESLEKLRACYDELSMIEQEETFVKGFSVAAKLLTEALT